MPGRRQGRLFQYVILGWHERGPEGPPFMESLQARVWVRW